MFLFEEDKEDLGVDFKSVRRVVNDLRRRTGGGAGRNEVAISDAFGKDLVGETDEVTIFDMIMDGRIPCSFVSFPVVTVAVVVEEFVDFGDGHRLVIAHGVVGDDVTWVKIGKRGGFRIVRDFQGEKSEDGDESKEKADFIN